MSFSHTYKTLRSGNVYDSHQLPEITSHEEDPTLETEIDASEQNDPTNTRFSPDMIEEKIKVNLEPLQDRFPPLRK